MTKRLFFTKFGWENDSPKEIERNIKLFALINTDLVIPSNHIYSVTAEDLFRNNPELLEKEIIRPALGDKYSNYEEYLLDREQKAGRKLVEYGRYLDSLNSRPEKYPSDSPAAIFTNHSMEQIKDPESILSKASKISKTEANRFLLYLTEVKNKNDGVIYFREFLNLSQKCLNPNAHNVFKKYAYLLRYTSGASSKNCNNLLPQENLVNWCLVNPNSPKNFILQDEQLFWEVFIESLIKVTEGIFSLKDFEKLSPKILDRLSFQDIHALRTEGVLKNKFIERYNGVIDKINVIRTSKENRTDLVKYDELIALKEEIRKEFVESLSGEASIYKEIELLEATAKVAYQIFGGTIQTIESVINFFNILFDKKKNVQKIMEKQENRITKAKMFVVQKMSNETTLIEYMNMLVLKAKESWHK